jgi:hypothetical protein
VKSRGVQTTNYGLRDRESYEEPQEDLIEWFGVLADRDLTLLQ